MRVNSLSHRYNVAILVAFSLIVSYLSWRFVETPFRNRKAKGNRRRLFIEAGCTLALFIVTGILILELHGLSYRFPPAALRIASQAGESPERSLTFRAGRCFLVSPEPFSHFSPSQCLSLDLSRSNYLLIGDSHAAALWYALSLQFKGVNVMQATSSNCKPFPGQGSASVCGQLMDLVFSSFLPRTHIDGLIITARWKVRDFAEIDRLADWCRARNIPLIVIGPSEEYDAPLPMLLAFSIRDGNPSLPFRHRLTDVEDLDRQMQLQAKNSWHVPYVSLIRIVCTSTNCRDYADDGNTIPMLFDHDHYSEAGAAFVIASAASSGKLDLGEKMASE